jgi:hypothetical protein
MPKAPKRAKGQAIAPRLDEARLRLTWNVPNEDQPRVIDLSQERGSHQLRLEMLRAFETKTHTDWRETATVHRAVNAARHLLGKCEEQCVETFSHLEPDLYGAMVEDLAEGWTERTRYTFETYVRLLLLTVDGLPVRTAWLLHQRQSSFLDVDRAAYSRDQFLALQRAAQRVASRAHRRITRAYDEALEGSVLPSWRDLPSGSPERRKRMLWALLTDEEPLTDEARARDLPSPSFTDGTFRLAAHWLMLTSRESVAVATLLMCSEGYNLSTIERLEVADLSGGIGDAHSDFYAVLNDKPRRRQRRYYTSLHEDLADDQQEDGLSPVQLRTGRVFRLVHEATDPARHYALSRGEKTSMLLLYASTTSDRRADSGAWAKTITRNLVSGVAAAGAYREGGWVPEGLRIDFAMLHRTFQVVAERAPTHNTRNTHVQEYLSKNPEARAEAHETTRNGFTQLIATTHQRMALRVSDESEVGAEVNSGAKDTATVACADITHHPVTGEACRDNFLMCLACDNAIATARHVPRLALLHEALEDLRSTLTSKGWERWQDHYLRLHAFLVKEANLNEKSIREAANRATRTDRAHVSRVLGGTYDVDR